MVPIKIVIHMTGLLLLTPENRNGVEMTHVLMPKPYAAFMPAHVAELGYRESESSRCTHPGDLYDGGRQICYRDMRGYYMEIGRPGALARPQERVQPDLGEINLSNATHHYVRQRMYSQDPESRLRSRITLIGAWRRNSCALYRWSFDNEPADIANVTTWVINTSDDDGVVRLMRARFGSDVQEELAPVRPIGDSVEIFIRQIPPDERAETYAGRATQNARSGRQASVDPETRARHFHAYYRLLHVSWLSHRPIPRWEGYSTTYDHCDWARRSDGLAVARIESVSRGPGTPTCMVAGGSPGP